MAAELQLIAAQGATETPFVTVKVTVNSEGKAEFDAFQVSLQCMEMAAEGVLEIDTNPGSCKVKDSFTAVVEAKPTKEVSCMLLCCYIE
jgi:NPL4 family